MADVILAAPGAILQLAGDAPHIFGPHILMLASCVLAVLAALVLAWFQPAEQRDGTVAGGLAIAGQSLSGAVLLAVSGAVYAWGEDGLAFALGIGAGFLLMQLLTGPPFAQSSASSVPDYFAKRYGPVTASLASVVVAVAMLVLLVAQVSAAGLVIARLCGLSLDAASAVGAGALLACALVRWNSSGSLVSGVVFPLVCAAVLIPAVALSIGVSHAPVPQLAQASALAQVQGLEEQLIDQDLADPAFMKPMLAPFISLSAANVLGIILGFAAGMACFPPALAGLRGRTTGSARWSLVWALVFACLMLTTLPALAEFARLSVLALVGQSTPIAQLPEWIFAYGRLGLVEVCGHAATDAATVLAACGAQPEPVSILHLQDLSLQPEAAALAVTEMRGHGPAMLSLLAGGVLASALLTAAAPLRAIVDALQTLAGRGSETPRGALSAVLAAAVVALAALAALAHPAGLLTLVSWSFTLAAAGLLPALSAGLWWRGANAYGACAALAAGFALALFYLAGTHFFAVPFFEIWGDMSSAGQMSRETFAELQDAWIAAAPGAAKTAAWEALEHHAQGIANWWGVKPAAVALLALPMGFIAVIAVSLVTGRRQTSD
jgi:cation/acetate symporter